MNTYSVPVHAHAACLSYSHVQATVMLELVTLLAPVTLMAETLISSVWLQTLLLTDRV